MDLTYLETGDLVTTGKELSVHRRSLGRSTHTVLVVLTDKDAGEVPELGHVESLKDLALVGSTVTVEGKSSGLFLVVLLGKGDTGADGNLLFLARRMDEKEGTGAWMKKKGTYLGTDDTVTAEERRSKDVHRTTLTERHTVLSAHQLGNDTLDGTASENGKSVASVRGDDSVLVGDGGLHTDGNGFLADGKVAETPDKLLLVKGVGGLLHSSHLNLHRGLVVVRRAKRHTYHFPTQKRKSRTMVRYMLINSSLVTVVSGGGASHR